MEQLTKTFEDLVRRIFGPATTLLFGLFVFHALEVAFSHNLSACTLFKSVDLLLSHFPDNKSTAALGFSLIFILGAGYIMATILTMAFESRLRQNFDEQGSEAKSTETENSGASSSQASQSGSTNNDLQQLRTLVLEKLKAHPRFAPFFRHNPNWLNEHDYFLYELLAAVDPMLTSYFVNSAKAYGVVCLSLAIALLSLLLCHQDWYLWFILIPSSIGLCVLTNAILKSKYRAWAERLYINFLLFPNEKVDVLLLDCDLKSDSLKHHLASALAPQPGFRYLCLLGSVGSAWRTTAHAFCEQRRIPCHDTLDPAWESISHENGDARQGEIDALVAKQQQLIAGAAAVYYQLDAQDEKGIPLAAHAARCELGYLTGIQKPTFVYIDPNVIGRNYLKAQARHHDHIHIFESGPAALEAACAFVHARALG